MTPAKNVLAALGASAISALTPAQAEATPTLLPHLQSTLTTAPLYGAAHTSDAKLGLNSGGLFNYNNDLSSGGLNTIINSGITDAGSWSDTHYLVSASGGIDLMNINTGLSDGSMGLSGYGVEAISSAFDYNGSKHFAIIDSTDDTVKYFQWGNNTPVHIGQNIGSNHSGLEVITDGSVSNLNDIPLLISRDIADGSKIEQHFRGTIVGSYRDGSTNPITDISYDASTGVLTSSHDLAGIFGRLNNYDFSSYAVPEPAQAGLLLGAGALAATAYRRRRD
jgi:hypothetical protein